MSYTSHSYQGGTSGPSHDYSGGMASSYIPTPVSTGPVSMVTASTTPFPDPNPNAKTAVYTGQPNEIPKQDTGNFFQQGNWVQATVQATGGQDTMNAIGRFIDNPFGVDATTLAAQRAAIGLPAVMETGSSVASTLNTVSSFVPGANLINPAYHVAGVVSESGRLGDVGKGISSVYGGDFNSVGGTFQNVAGIAGDALQVGMGVAQIAEPPGALLNNLGTRAENYFNGTSEGLTRGIEETRPGLSGYASADAKEANFFAERSNDRIFGNSETSWPAGEGQLTSERALMEGKYAEGPTGSTSFPSWNETKGDYFTESVPHAPGGIRQFPNAEAEFNASAAERTERYNKAFDRGEVEFRANQNARENTGFEAARSNPGLLDRLKNGANDVVTGVKRGAAHISRGVDEMHERIAGFNHTPDTINAGTVEGLPESGTTAIERMQQHGINAPLSLREELRQQGITAASIRQETNPQAEMKFQQEFQHNPSAFRERLADRTASTVRNTPWSKVGDTYTQATQQIENGRFVSSEMKTPDLSAGFQAGTLQDELKQARTMQTEQDRIRQTLSTTGSPRTPTTPQSGTRLFGDEAKVTPSPSTGSSGRIDLLREGTGTPMTGTPTTPITPIMEEKAPWSYTVSDLMQDARDNLATEIQKDTLRNARFAEELRNASRAEQEKFFGTGESSSPRGNFDPRISPSQWEYTHRGALGYGDDVHTIIRHTPL